MCFLGSFRLYAAGASPPPAEMLQLRLVKHIASMADADAGAFEVATVPTPKPRSGQVLVKVEVAPINPSDLSTMKGSYNSAQREQLPCGLGYEASGVVVAAGGGVMARRLLGKRVAIASTGGGKTYAQYATAPAMTCIVLPDDVSFEEGSSCFVNPLTALAFMELAKARRVGTIVHTAAASALGKMVIRVGKVMGVNVIGVVRKPAQRDELMALGAVGVAVSTEPDFVDQLKALTAEHNATLAFDAVAGKLTGQLLQAMPSKSSVQVYGGLSEQPAGGIRATDLIFRRSSVSGFWLTPHLGAKSLLGKAGMLRSVTTHLKTCLSTSIRKTYSLDQAAEAVAEYSGNMSAGKVAFRPNA